MTKIRTKNILANINIVAENACFGCDKSALMLNIVDKNLNKTMAVNRFTSIKSTFELPELCY